MKLQLERALRLLPLVAAAACTETPPEPLPPLPPVAITLSTERPAQRTTEKATLRWAIAGDPAGRKLYLEARPPGPPPPSTQARYVRQSLSPSAGRSYFLGPDGTWSDQPLAFAEEPASGELEVALPEPREGEWRLEARLGPSADGRVDARSVARVVASDRPALFLRLSRTLAGTDDAIRVTLVTAAGPAPRSQVVVLSSHTGPDGTRRPFPANGLQEETIFDGEAADTQLPLANDLFGAGNHSLSFQLYDRASGRLLDFVEAGFSVCDALADVAGVLRDSDGVALPGTDREIATVELIDFDDPGQSLTAPDAEGRFQVRLPPGRYGVVATVLDERGLHRAFGATEVGCEGAVPLLELRAEPPLAPAELDSTSSELQLEVGELKQAAEAPPASDGQPKPLVTVAYQPTQGFLAATPPSKVAELLKRVMSALRAQAPDVIFFSEEDRRDLLRKDAQEQAEGGDSTGASDAVAFLSENSRYSLQFKVDMPNDDYGVVSMHLHDGAGWRVVAAKQGSASGLRQGAYSRILPVALGVAEKMTLETEDEPWEGPRPLPLLPMIRRNELAEWPRRPELSLELAPREVGPGASVQVTARLRDLGGAEPPAGRVFEGGSFRIWTPNGDMKSATVEVDAQNGWSATYPAGQQAGDGRAQLDLEVPGRSPQSKMAWYKVREVGALTLTADKAELGRGQTTSVTAALRDLGSGAPIVGRPIALSATIGTLDVPSVVTGADGKAQFTYTAGAGPALARIKGLAGDLGQGEALVKIRPAGEIVLTQSPPGRLANGARATVTVDVRADDAPLPRASLTVSVSGGGSISTAWVRADDQGLATFEYAAPPNGSGIGAVTVSTVIDGKPVQATLGIGYGPAQSGADPRIEIFVAGSPPSSRACAWDSLSDLGRVYDAANCGPSVDPQRPPTAPPFTAAGTSPEGSKTTMRVTGDGARAVVEVDTDLKWGARVSTGSLQMRFTAKKRGTVTVRLNPAWGKLFADCGECKVRAATNGPVRWYWDNPTSNLETTTTPYDPGPLMNGELALTLTWSAISSNLGGEWFQQSLVLSGELMTVSFSPE